MKPDDCGSNKEVCQQLECIQTTLTELGEQQATQLKELSLVQYYNGTEHRNGRMTGQMPLQSQHHTDELWDTMLPLVTIAQYQQ